MRDAVFWFDREVEPLAPLEGAVRADVIVVGGGMMGLMCARELVARGMSVCLLEATTCGSAASGRSSGLVTPDSELEFHDLLEQFGRADAPRLWDFASQGLRSIREAVVVEGIDCDLQAQDALYVATTERAAQIVFREHASRQAFGYDCTHFARASLTSVLGSSAYFGGLRFGGTFGINAYDACLGLGRRLVDAGARVFEHSAVARIIDGGVETARGSAHASAVIICADRFLPQLGMARREVYHAQTFLCISEPLARADAERMFPQGPLMVWDTDLTYKYFRLTGDRRLLIGGGTLASTYARREQHHPQAAARLATRYLDEKFPGLRVRFAACWPGLIGISKDFAPVVGRHSRHPSVRFAAGAAGLPWAAALGGYLADQVADGRDDLDGVLSVDRRFPVGPRVQAITGAPLAFALSHGIRKFL